MKLVNDGGNVKVYEGLFGHAVITKNFGNRDKNDKWSVAVDVDGQYKKLANRVEFQKAYTLAEHAIDL